MDERIGFGLYQSCGNRGSVGRVSVLWLCWCGWCRLGVGRGLGPGSGGVKCFYVCLSPDSLCRWQVQLSVYCAMRIPAHFRRIQCSIQLHHIDICFLPCICLWQISQIQGIMEEACSSRSLQDNKTNSPSQVVY